MATVYLAHDLRHDRPVALKVLHSELAHALGPERFQREIRLAARLQHPHILTVHDSGEAAGQLWFTMPFIEGESLRDRLNREKQLPLDDAIRITREAADALEYAHRHGVIHRDIKPENILLSGNHALVADFGIARALSGDSEKLTSTGSSIGTAAYMSPEQAAGEHDLDARSDVYSLGTVLHEMLAGETPFTAATPQSMIARRFTEHPKPLRTVRDTVPAAVEQAVLKALARTPADRFASAEAFGASLGTAVAPAVAAPASRTGESRAGPAAGSQRIPARRRVSPALTMLGLGFILGLGLLFAWNRNRGGGEHDAETPFVAVLPFENIGAADDQYFADGMTEEVRGRLAALPGLRVIASGSSRQYRESTKTLPEIGRELGARYLLVATVRWAKASDGTSRVRVSPELVEVTGAAPTTRWQEPFDAALTDVFKVQADIAGRVADALGVALGSDQQQKLSARPTKSLAAYDFYLRAVTDVAGDPAALRRKGALYEQAVSADPNFTEAWRGLAGTLSRLYSNTTPNPAVAARARAAAERALALDPTVPHGHAALAAYHMAVRRDFAEAGRHIELALRLAPNEPDLLGMAAAIERGEGRSDVALAHLRQARRLDPRSLTVATRLQIALLWLRRYPDALAASDTALALAPGDLSLIQDRAMVFAAQGDLTRARAVMKEVSPAVKPTELVAFFGNYWDMYWVLDEAQQRLLLGTGPSAFDDDRGAWATVLMQTYAIRGDRPRARAYADTAYQESRALLKNVGDDAQRIVISGLQLAYLGRKAEAIAAAERGMALAPIAKDMANGPYYQQIAARTYLELGETDKALDLLEPLLNMPYFLSPGWLRIDPSFAALRGNPRFERLVGR